MATCPNGHPTTATDYCDVCGSPLGPDAAFGQAPAPAAGSLVSATGTPSAGGASVTLPAGAFLVCPHCHAANPDSALFCEACGYDFTTGTLPRSAAGADSAGPASGPATAPAAPAAATALGGATVAGGATVTGRPSGLGGATAFGRANPLDLDAPVPPAPVTPAPSRMVPNAVSLTPAEPAEEAEALPVSVAPQVFGAASGVADEVVDADVVADPAPEPLPVVPPAVSPSPARQALPPASPPLAEAPWAPAAPSAAVSAPVAPAPIPLPGSAPVVEAPAVPTPAVPFPIPEPAPVVAEPASTTPQGAEWSAAPATPAAPTVVEPASTTPQGAEWSATSAPAPASPAVPASALPVGKADWVAEVWIDPDWYAVQESPDQIPSPGLPRVTGLRGRSWLIGRPSRSRGIHPDIDCEPDTGVSRRHAEVSTDGTRWFVEDAGSSNGTFVGVAGQLPTDPIKGKTELGPDSRVYVGSWTRIVVRRASPDEVDL